MKSNAFESTYCKIRILTVMKNDYILNAFASPILNIDKSQT